MAGKGLPLFNPAAVPKIGVLALQGDYEAHALALREAGAETLLVRMAAELEDIDGLVLPGGESTTLIKLLDRAELWDPLQSFVLQNPVFGTCAGCILLAREVVSPSQKSLHSLNATVERNAYGRQNDSAIVTGETFLEGGPLEMVYIRAPRIQRIGAGVTVLAERDGSPVLVRQGSVLAATFHPELSSDRRIHRLFLELVAGHKARGSESSPEVAREKV